MNGITIFPCPDHGCVHDAEHPVYEGEAECARRYTDELRAAGYLPQPGFADTAAPERTPCACGTDVDRRPDEGIAAAVYRHNRSAVHRRWWERVKAAWQ